MGSLTEESGLLRPAFAPDLVGRQGHAHAHGGIGPGALGHHVRDGPDHLLIGLADLEPDLSRVDPAVQDADPAALIPCHIFVLQEKGHPLIHAFHWKRLLPACLLPSYSIGPGNANEKAEKRPYILTGRIDGPQAFFSVREPDERLV